MPSLYDDEAMTPLVNSDGHARSKKNGAGLMINRVLVIVLAAAVVAVSTFFQAEQSQLTQQLASDEEKIQLLKDTVEAQNSIIQRFNESVTNTDVLKRLKLLEHDLQDTKVDLKHELNQTISDVNAHLENTMTVLDDTVKKAEMEIKDQVDIVKKDFEKYVIQTEDKFSMENSFMVYQLAGTITLLSCLISMWHMTAHIQRMNQPVIQRKILAILWMSPIYAVTSWFSLVFPVAEGYLAIIKDAYEAYVIYQFLSFCIAVLGKGNRAAVVDLLTRRADHLAPPFRLCPCTKGDGYEDPHALAEAILLQCQFFALQFVFFRPLTTIAKVMLAKFDYYGPWADSANDWRAPQLYITLIQNVSIFVAFTGLLKFYHAVDKDLEWCRPFAKFLCIKGVVFMTFWQGLAITILAETTDVGGADAEEWASSAQNFLICLEMLLFSIAHFYCFPTYEWEDDYRANFNKAKYGFKETLALGDFISDLKLVMKGSKKKKKIAKEPSEPTVPEGDEETPTEGGDDDGSETVLSDATGSTSQTEDQKRSLAEDVANIIADDVENPDLEDVRRRISGFLEDMSFLPGEAEVLREQESGETSESAMPRGDSGDDWVPIDNDEEGAREKASPVGSASYGSTAPNDEDEDEPAPRIVDWVTGEGEEESPSERTGLLGGTATAQSPLRPSIFTTIADMSESEKRSKPRNEGD